MIAKVIGIILVTLRVLYWYAEALYRQFVPPPMKSIDGETILVTGAAGGIGTEICKRLVKSGRDIKLVVWDMNQQALDKLVSQLRSSGSPGHKVIPILVDVSARENIDIACQQTKDAVGAVTILFNNAGILPMGTMLQLTNEEIQKTIDINLTSHLWIIRQFLPEMVSKNYGRIVNTCSIAGLKGASHSVAYFASKFGVNGYTEGLKAELRLQNYRYNGIKFTTVYPYFVQTPLIGSLAVNKNSGVMMPYGLNEFCKPEEVAKNMVDGMRREYEYVHCPKTIPWMCFVEYLIPLKARQAINDKYMNPENFMMKDRKEHDRLFNTPYLDAVRRS